MYGYVYYVKLRMAVCSAFGPGRRSPMQYPCPAPPDPQTLGSRLDITGAALSCAAPACSGRRPMPTPLVSNKNRYRTTNAVSALLLDSNLAALLGENRALTVCAPVPSSTFQIA